MWNTKAGRTVDQRGEDLRAVGHVVSVYQRSQLRALFLVTSLRTCELSAIPVFRSQK